MTQQDLTAFTQRLRTRIADPFHLPSSMKHGSLLSYLMTVLLMWFALWVRLAIASVSAGLQYVTFFPAVTLAAIAGGYRTGLLATAFGLTFATYIFTPPYYSFSVADLRTSMWSNLVFLFDGIIMSFAIEAMHRYRQRYAKELEQSRDAHALLQESTQYLQTILDNIFSYVALLDTNGVIQEMNKVPFERDGGCRQDVIGKFYQEEPWWTYDEKVRSQLIAAIEAAKQGQTRRFDTIVKMGADLVPVDFQIAPVREGDTASRLGGDEFVVMLEDLSANFEESTIMVKTVGEKILATIIGGMIGIILSYGVGLIFSLFVSSFAMKFSVISIISAFLCSTIIGVVFGFIPARNAARLDPIEALARE